MKHFTSFLLCLVLSLSFNTAHATEFSFTPVSGACVERLDSIIVESEGLTLGNSTSKIILRDKNNNNQQVTTGTVIYCESDSAIILLETFVEKPGSYFLNIPKNTFEGQTERISLDYTVIEPVVIYDNVTIVPETGSTVETLKDFVLTYIDADYISLNGDSHEIALFDDRGNVLAQVSETSIQANEIFLSLNTEIKNPGIYTLAFPAGVFLIDDESLSSIQQFEFIIEAPSEAEVLVIDKDGSVVDEISQIQLIFPDASYISLEDGLNAIVFNDEENNVVTTAKSCEIRANTVTIYFEDVIKKAGQYQIMIPKGLFMADDELESPELLIHYTIEFNEVVTIDPEPYSVLQSLQSFTLEYQGVDVLTLDNSLVPQILVSNSDSTLTSAASVSVDGNKAKVTLLKKVDTAGSISVKIPEGLFMLDNKYSSNKQTINYIIYKASFNPEIEEGSIVQKIDTLVFVFSSTQIEFNKYYRHINVYDSNDELVSWINIYHNQGKLRYEGNRAIMTLNNSIIQDGEYRIEVPDSAFFIGPSKIPSEPLTIHYTVQEPTPRTLFELNPAPGTVRELSYIEITFPEVESISLSDRKERIEIIDAEHTYESFSFCTKSEVIVKGNMACIYLVERIEATRMHEMTIPAGYFNLSDGRYNNSATVLYDVNPLGIEENSTDDSDALIIFSISGQKLNIQSKEELQSGLYIINGKRIFIQ